MAASVLAELGSPAANSVRLLLDLYHTQIIGGDVTMAIREHLPIAGHVQIAGVPERFEPDTMQASVYRVAPEISARV